MTDPVTPLDLDAMEVFIASELEQAHYARVKPMLEEIRLLRADNERLMHHVRASPSLSNQYVRLAETEIDAQRKRVGELQDQVRILTKERDDSREAFLNSCARAVKSWPEIIPWARLKKQAEKGGVEIEAYIESMNAHIENQRREIARLQGSSQELDIFDQHPFGTLFQKRDGQVIAMTPDGVSKTIYDKNAVAKAEGAVPKRKAYSTTQGGPEYDAP